MLVDTANKLRALQRWLVALSFLIFGTGVVIVGREVFREGVPGVRQLNLDLLTYIYVGLISPATAAVIPLSAAGIIQAMMLLRQDRIDLDWEDAGPADDESEL